MKIKTADIIDLTDNYSDIKMVLVAIETKPRCAFEFFDISPEPESKSNKHIVQLLYYGEHLLEFTLDIYEGYEVINSSQSKENIILFLGKRKVE